MPGYLLDSPRPGAIYYKQPKSKLKKLFTGDRGVIEEVYPATPPPPPPIMGTMPQPPWEQDKGPIRRFLEDHIEWGKRVCPLLSASRRASLTTPFSVPPDHLLHLRLMTVWLIWAPARASSPRHDVATGESWSRHTRHDRYRPMECGSLGVSFPGRSTAASAGAVRGARESPTVSHCAIRRRPA